jgi:4-amino-4-deoxy-L-arabinose transferase-like glycosyltransferase
MGTATEITKDTSMALPEAFLARRPGHHTIILAFLFLLMAVGLLIRLINLGYPSLFMDEFNHIYAAQSLIETGEPLLPSGEPYTRSLPFTLLVAASFKLFGVSETSARLPSVIFGVLLIPIGFLLGRAFYGKWAGLMTAFLLTFLILPVGWSRASRMYILFAVLYALVVICFYKGFEPSKGLRGKPEPHYSIRSINPGWLLLAALLLALAYSVQMLAGLFVLSVLAYCLVMAVGVAVRKGVKPALLSKYGVLLIASALGGILLLATTSLLQSMWALSRECPPYAVWRADNYAYYVSTMLGTRFDMLAIIGALVLATSGKRGRYLLCALIIPLLFHSFLLRWKAERYVVYLYPLFLVVASVGALTVAAWLIKAVEALARRLGTGEKRLRMVRLAAGIGLAIFALVNYSSLRVGAFAFREYHGVTVPHNDWRGAGQYVKEHMQPNDAMASAVPLASIFYIGKKPEYSVRRFETFDLDEANSGQHRDRYAGAIILEDVPMIQAMMNEHPRGWLVVDESRWNRFMLSDEQRDYIEQHMRRHPQASDGTVRVYSWGI